MLLEMGINGVIINTDGTESNIIENDSNANVKIEVQVKGASGDSDRVEIWFKESLGGGRFETGRGINIASIYLDSDDKIVRNFKLPDFTKCILTFRMRDNSGETPVTTCYYKLNA